MVWQNARKKSSHPAPLTIPASPTPDGCDLYMALFEASNWKKEQIVK
jgi:hypothetical protein